MGRLLYRSKQRGFLELDLVLGTWVEDHIGGMDQLHVRALSDVLDLVSLIDFCSIFHLFLASVNFTIYVVSVPCSFPRKYNILLKSANCK